jgi:hypothetical protein
MNDFSFQSLCIQRRKAHFKHHSCLQISSNIQPYFTVCYTEPILNMRNPKLPNHCCLQGQQSVLY